MHGLLNFIHVSGAIVWAGGIFFLWLFVTPAAKTAGDGAAPFMGALIRGRLADVMTWAAFITVGSGIWLWIRAFAVAPPATFAGVAITVGALAGLVAFLVGVFRQGPTIRLMRDTLAEMAAGDRRPSPELIDRLGVLRQAMATNGNLLAVSAAVAVAGMGLAG